ncbi:MAG: hypothetical protein M1816_007422 [Peltula sp. TS41687]|nr:MAG: hypothetical protein M1816_007422 [Peltula sp. TS41687]
MRLGIWLMQLSIWLVVVAAAPPKRRLDASSWETYRIYRNKPSFPPPDLGPLQLPEGYFDDKSHLTVNQQFWIKQKLIVEHTHHQQEIAEQWRKTGQLPTEQELKDRAQQIQTEIEKRVQGYEDTPAADIGRIDTKLQKRIGKLKELRAHKPDYESIIQTSEEQLRNAQTSVERYRVELDAISAQTKKLRVKQKPYSSDSRQYGEIQKQLQELRAKWVELNGRKKEAEHSVQVARNRLRQANTRKYRNGKEIEKLEKEIQELTEQMKELKNRGRPETDTGPKPDIVSEVRAQDQNQDHNQDQNQNHVSLTTTLENGAKEWMKGFGGLLNEVNHRLSSPGGAAGDVHLRPFAGSLPIPGLISVP